MTSELLSLQEASDYLQKSTKTISRYIKAGRIKPVKVKSKNGTLEYRFTKDSLDNIAETLTEELNQETKQPQKVKVNSDNYKEVITLLKENTDLLREQLKVKDEQLKAYSEQVNNLLERQKENNILTSHLQRKLLLTDGGQDTEDNEGQDRGQEGQTRKRNFLERIFNI